MNIATYILAFALCRLFLNYDAYTNNILIMRVDLVGKFFISDLVSGVDFCDLAVFVNLKFIIYTQLLVMW